MKNNNLKKMILALGAGFILIQSAVAQDGHGEIRGVIKNSDKEIVPFATIKVLQGAQLIGGSQSDERGRYVYKPLTPGTYELVVMSAEYMTQPVNKIMVIPNEATYVDVKLSPNTLATLTVTAKAIDYTPPGVDRNMYSMKSVDYKELNTMSNYVAGDINSAVVGITSEVVEMKGELHFRGTRGDASSNYVDGVRTYGSTFVPGMAIENLTVFSGGVPACYGDVVGGVVIINTKSYFSGIRDKNMRNTEYREKLAEEKRMKQDEEDEKNRLKEIEAEKAKDKEGK